MARAQSAETYWAYVSAVVASFRMGDQSGYNILYTNTRYTTLPTLKPTKTYKNQI